MLSGGDIDGISRLYGIIPNRTIIRPTQSTRKWRYRSVFFMASQITSVLLSHPGRGGRTNQC